MTGHEQALETARSLAAAGVPVFVAYPHPDKPGDYLPRGRWQQTSPNPAYVDAWRPGLALCAVMGQGIDLVDIDPRNGGDTATLAGLTPEVLGAAISPSGGYHLFVRSMGVRSRDGVLPGIDVKAGDPDGDGRGFAFIAPTVRISKTTGEPATYKWVNIPDLAKLNGHTGADSKLAELVRQAHGSHKQATGAGFTQPTDPERKHAGPIPYGEHHARLVAYAGWLRSKAIPLRPEAETLMLHRLGDCEQPPGANRPRYTEDEALGELHDIYSRYQAGDPPPNRPANGRGPVSASENSQRAARCRRPRLSRHQNPHRRVAVLATHWPGSAANPATVRHSSPWISPAVSPPAPHGTVTPSPRAASCTLSPKAYLACRSG